MLEMNEKRRGEVARNRKGKQQNQINVFLESLNTIRGTRQKALTFFCGWIWPGRSQEA
jgi:hypothetical protein